MRVGKAARATAIRTRRRPSLSRVLLKVSRRAASSLRWRARGSSAVEMGHSPRATSRLQARARTGRERRFGNKRCPEARGGFRRRAARPPAGRRSRAREPPDGREADYVSQACARRATASSRTSERVASGKALFFFDAVSSARAGRRSQMSPAPFAASWPNSRPRNPDRRKALDNLASHCLLKNDETSGGRRCSVSCAQRLSDRAIHGTGRDGRSAGLQIRTGRVPRRGARCSERRRRTFRGRTTGRRCCTGPAGRTTGSFRTSRPWPRPLLHAGRRTDYLNRYYGRFAVNRLDDPRAAEAPRSSTTRRPSAPTRRARRIVDPSDPAAARPVSRSFRAQLGLGSAIRPSTGCKYAQENVGRLVGDSGDDRLDLPAGGARKRHPDSRCSAASMP